jgi:tetratricopeptide (TPR) repeat protein
VSGRDSLEAILVTIAILLALVVVPGAPKGTLQKRNTGPTQAASRPTRPEGRVKIATGQPGSVVFLNNVRNGVTSGSGELILDRIKMGTYSVRVRTIGYDDWSGRIIVRAQGETSLKIKQISTTDQAILHYQKADSLRDAGGQDEAVSEYKQALRINPRLTVAAIGCARSLIAMQQLEDAETMLQKAVRSPAGGHLAEAETVLGNLRRSQELLDEAISYYRKALVIAHAVSPEAHIGLALALEEKGAIDEAVTHFRLGLAQDMDTEPILYYLLGRALEKHERNKEAIEAYSGYLRLDPNGQYSSAVQSIIEQLKASKD